MPVVFISSFTIVVLVPNTPVAAVIVPPAKMLFDAVISVNGCIKLLACTVAAVSPGSPLSPLGPFAATVTDVD